VETMNFINVSIDTIKGFFCCFIYSYHQKPFGVKTSTHKDCVCEVQVQLMHKVAKAMKLYICGNKKREPVARATGKLPPQSFPQQVPSNIPVASALTHSFSLHPRFCRQKW